MAIVERYAAGTPSWVDLATSDPDAARSFYGTLFGWEFEVGGPEQGGYTMCRLRGQNVAGIGEATTAMPPAWTTYLASDDVAAAAGRIEAAGGSVLMGPMEIAPAGHMVFGSDPTGAVFGLWQPIEHIGASLVNEPGSIVWNELATRDLDRAADFYSEAVGWTWEDADTGEGGPRYRTYAVDGTMVGGALEMTDAWPADLPSHWMPYFAVEDADAAAAAAERAGGTIVQPPMDTPYGRICVVRDPQGAVFTVMAVAPSPTS